MYKIIKILLYIMLVAIFATNIIYIFFQNKKDTEQEKKFDELENIVIQENNIENNKDNKNEDLINENKQEIDLKKLYELNTDFIGWLKINNTNISYPVMQTSEDNKDYYLRRNFNKEYSYLGTPYIAEYCNVLESDNLIIYGHHINGNKLFGELEKYKNKEFYNKHKIIEFNTIYEKANYEIIAVFKTVAYTGFNYYKFYNASSKEEFDTFVAKCKELSFYDIQNSAEYGDKLITLSTCEYSNTNGRLVVVAKKVL